MDSRQNSSDIHEIQGIDELLRLCHINSLIGWDIDNTIYEPGSAYDDLGSDQWFGCLIELARQRFSHGDEALQLSIILFREVHHLISVKAIEPGTVKTIHMLQDLHLPTLAITARGSDILDLTIDQLNQIDIHFNKQWGEVSFDLDIGDTANPPRFHHGVIFCNGHDKATCFNAFINQAGRFYEKAPIDAKIRHFALQTLELLSRKKLEVIMVDDKKKNLLIVEALAARHGWSFTGLRYARLDEKVNQFDMSKATNQMIKIKGFFTRSGKDAAQKIAVESATTISHEDKTTLLQQHSFLVRRESLPLAAIDNQEKPFTHKQTAIR